MDIPKRIKLVKEPINYVDEERPSDRYQFLKNEIDRPTKRPTLLMWDHCGLVTEWKREKSFLTIARQSSTLGDPSEMLT